MSRVRQMLLVGEDALQRAFQRVDAERTAQRGRSRVDLSYFRGRHCHCEPGLPLHLVHSEGLREACDFVIDLGANATHPERPPFPIEQLKPYVSQLPLGSVIHLKADHIDAFAREVLPCLRAKVVVVSGDSDTPFGSEHAHLLEHPQIAHWFAQNCAFDTPHPRLTRIPIGFDNPVYTKLEKRIGFALTALLGKTPFDASLLKNDIGNQALLQRIATELVPTQERKPQALCTFHMNQKLIKPDLSSIPDRQRAFEVLRDSPACHFVTRRLRQEECWRAHGEYAFQISPRGNGLDCFRTWESLFLGVIPIVRSSPLDALYRAEQLPVVIVEAWEQVTEANLRRWQDELAPRFDDTLRHKLTCDFWLTKIDEARASAKVGGYTC